MRCLDWVQICSMTLKTTNCYLLHRIALWPMGLMGPILYFQWLFLFVCSIYLIFYSIKLKNHVVVLYISVGKILSNYSITEILFHQLSLMGFIDHLEHSVHVCLFHHVSDYTFPLWVFYLYCGEFYTVVTWVTIQHNLC